MEPEDPKKLDYAEPDTPDTEDDRVRRYYREPPDLGQLIGIFVAVVVGVVLLLAIGFLMLRGRL